MTLEELGGWPAVLGPLMTGTDLSPEAAAAAMAEVLAGTASPAQIAGFAVALRMKGETVAEMAGFVNAMVALAERVPLSPETAAVAIDTCGTGGDRSGTINVSTIAAMVAAGAGAKVCKHGGRASSSQTGSCDVLEALGVVIDLGPDGVARCVEEVGMGFCFAPRFHPAMRHVAGARRELGVPTVFNFLGPLANPARVRRQVVGVSDPRMADNMVRVLAAGGSEHAMVVYGHDGLDKLTTAMTSTIVELRDGAVQAFDIDPRDFGFEPGAPGDLLGGNAALNADRVRAILGGEAGPQRDIVVLNAAAAIVVAGLAEDFVAGVAAAADSLDTGSAATVLDGLVRVSVAASET